MHNVHRYTHTRTRHSLLRPRDPRKDVLRETCTMLTSTALDAGLVTDRHDVHMDEREIPHLTLFQSARRTDIVQLKAQHSRDGPVQYRQHGDLIRRPLCSDHNLAF